MTNMTILGKMTLVTKIIEKNCIPVELFLINFRVNRYFSEAVIYSSKVFQDFYDAEDLQIISIFWNWPNFRPLTIFCDTEIAKVAELLHLMIYIDTELCHS